MTGRGTCQTIKCMLMNPTNIFLFVCELVWFGLIWLGLVVKSKTQMESIPGERTKQPESMELALLHSPAPTFVPERNGQVLNGLPWSIPVGELTTCSWVNFAPHEGTETHWDTVLDHLSLATSFWKPFRPRNSKDRCHPRASKGSF